MLTDSANALKRFQNKPVEFQKTFIRCNRDFL